MTAHHYFATHALGYATGVTRDDAIDNLLRGPNSHGVKAWLLNIQKAGNPGLPMFITRVPLAADASYKISFYQPDVEGLTESQNRILTYISKKDFATMADPNDRIRQLESDLKAVEDAPA